MQSLLPSVRPELLERYGGPVPRYTSYPTALDWRGDVTGTDYPALLRQAAGEEGPLALYVHVPFCEERCLFCGCNVRVTRDRSRGGSYVDLVRSELSVLKESGIGRRLLAQYHWGGGTPTWLPLEDMEALHAAVTEVFTLAPGCEAAIEVDPRVTSTEQIRLLARLGFNRISVGVQDFDPRVQEAIKRVQSFEDTRRVIDEARAAGFRSVNVDLLQGLPYQTRAHFRATLERVLELTPERVALFHYAHVPWMKKHHRAIDMAAAPSPQEKLGIFADAVAAFGGAGYDFIGLDHFALRDDELARARREHRLHRNFMGYTTKAARDLVGLGVSSIGEVAGAYVQNERELPEWTSRVESTGHGMFRGHRLDADDRLRRDVIMRIMCHGSVDKSEVERTHGIDFDGTFEDELRDLREPARDGLVELEAGRITVTPAGRVFVRHVAAPFDRYLRARRRSREGTERTFSRVL